MASETNAVAQPLLGMRSAWLWGVPVFAITGLLLLLLTDGNVLAFRWLNGLAAQAGDEIWAHLSLLGDTAVALMFMLPLLGRRPEVSWQFVLAALWATLWSHGMKVLFATMRPPAILAPGSFHLIGPMLEQHSFPSGHTTTIFVLAGLVCLQPIKQHWKVAALVVAVLVGWSRIACGVHWPLDVLGGMFGGWISAVAGVWLAQHWLAGLKIEFQRGLAVLLSLSAMWTIFVYDSGFAGVWWLQFVLTAGCLVWSLPGLYRLFRVRSWSSK